MSRLDLILLLALLAGSLLLVRTSYEARRLFAELDRARTEQRRLDADFKRLDAERQAQATHLRVEKVAREKLAMRTATPVVTTYVVDTEASTAVPAGASVAQPAGRFGVAYASGASGVASAGAASGGRP